MSHDDNAPVPGFDPEEMLSWMTTGAGADLAGATASGDAPTHLLPEAGAPISVMRNVRLPYEVDQALKSTAAARGVSVSDLMREAITTLLAGETEAAPDPVATLRLTLAAAGRAVDRLAANCPNAA